MPTEIILSRVRAYRTMRDRLLEARAAEFKSGRGVRVVSDRYNGYGMVVDDDGCPPDQLAVKLENGNTWWYPLEGCSLANRGTCPPWLQRLMKFESNSVTIRAMVLRDQSHAASGGGEG